jgi:hypothetical protein
MTPPDLGVPSLQGGTASGAGLGTDVWTEATDAKPAGATKPVWQVACGSPVQAYENAIPTRIAFGNMQLRFSPEMVAANTEQAIATAAREADHNLLAKMYDASKQVLPEQYLGATRDLLARGTRDARRMGVVGSQTPVSPGSRRPPFRRVAHLELLLDTLDEYGERTSCHTEANRRSRTVSARSALLRVPTK